jgi:hypothetical protein
MGREVKRVAKDFDWPLNKVWEGYLNPHYVECSDCENGSTPAKRYFDMAIFHLMHGHKQDWGETLPESAKRQFKELTEGLAGRAKNGLLGHDAIDVWSAQRKIKEAAGLDEKWGWCETCGGDDIHPDHKEAYEAWEETDPPSGDCWQLWENTTEGSPISPVFETKEAFITWLVEDQGHRRESSEKFCELGSVPSMMLGSSGLKKNIDILDES